MKNKWIICGTILAAICVSCTSCGALHSKPEPTVLENTATAQPTPEPTTEPIAMNKDDKISNDMAEIKVKKVSFTKDIVPEYKIATYAHYPASEGRVYLEVKTKVKNLLDKDLSCEDVATVTLRTETGESYMAFVVPETEARGISDDPSIPISKGKTLGVRYVIDCPKELEKSADGLKLYIQLSEEKVYEYTVR